MGCGEKKDKLETRRQPGKPHIFPVACTVAVKFPRSTEKTEVKLKWGVEDNEALHLGSAEMERGRHSPSSPGHQGGKTGGRWRELGEGEGGGGHCLDNRNIHKGKRGWEVQMICSFTGGHLRS